MSTHHRVHRPLFHLLLLMFVLLLMAVLAVDTPTMVYSATKAPTNTPTAAPRLNIADVLLNMRAMSSFHSTITLKVQEKNIGNFYDAIFFSDLSAWKIAEEVKTLDIEPLSLTDPNTTIGIIFGSSAQENWTGNSFDDLSLVEGESEVATRLPAQLITFGFHEEPPGNFAKLKKANRKVNGVSCDEYSWTKDGAPATICVTRDTGLPIHRTMVWNKNVEAEVFYSDYGAPANVFKLPHQDEGVYITDAFMSLNKLANFEYKVTFSVASGASKVVVDGLAQGTYEQAHSAWQAKYWAKSDDTSAPPKQRVIQIGRLRWQAPGDEKRPYVKVKPYDPVGVIQFGDPFTRTDPFLAWISMAGVPDLNMPGEQVDTDVKFDGKPAREYRYELDKDNYVILRILPRGGFPIYAEQHYKDKPGDPADIITWELLSMDKPDVQIQQP